MKTSIKPASFEEKEQYKQKLSEVTQRKNTFPDLNRLFYSLDDEYIAYLATLGIEGTKELTFRQYFDAEIDRLRNMI